MDSRIRNGMVAMFLVSAAGVIALLLDWPLIVSIMLFLGACLAGAYVVKQALRHR